MNYYTLWPYVALLVGTYFLANAFLGPWPASKAGTAIRSEEKPTRSYDWLYRTRDIAWYKQIALPVYMVHQFEEHGIDLLGRHYAFQAILCNELVCYSDFFELALSRK